MAMTEEQARTEIDQIWPMFDKNSNGYLEKSEVENFHNFCAQNIPDYPFKTTPFEEVFAKIDHNADDKVTKDEMVKWFLES